MRLQSLYIFSTIIFLLFNVSYSECTTTKNKKVISNEQNSTKNLAVGNGFEEKIFAEKFDIGEKVYYRQIEVGTDGNIYVRDNLGEIIVFTPKKEFVKRIKKTDLKFDDRKDYIVLFPNFDKENLVSLDGYSRIITDCEEDKDGNVYLSAIQGDKIAKILKYNEQGEKLFEIFVTVNKYTGPVDLEIDDFGNIVVANTTDNTLDVYDKNGKFLYGHQASFEREKADGMSGLCDIALDESGNIYAIDRYANRIKKFTLIKKQISHLEWKAKETEELIEKLKDGSPNEIHNAIRRLNRTTDPKVVKILIHTFSNSKIDDRIRQDLILSLASIGKSAIPFLVEALKNPNRKIKEGIIEVLLLNNDQSVVIPLLDLVREDEGWRRYVNEVFHYMDNIPIKILLRCIEDNNEDINVQWIALEAIGKNKDKRAVSIIIDAMKRDSRIRSKGADALGLIGDKTAIPDLIEILKSESNMHFIGTRLMYALSGLKAKEAVDIIIERGLKNEDHYVRRDAARALREIEDPKAIPALKEALETEQNGNAKSAITWAIRELEKKTQK